MPIDSVMVDRTGDVGVMTTLAPGKMRGLYGGFMPEKTKCLSGIPYRPGLFRAINRPHAL